MTLNIEQDVYNETIYELCSINNISKTVEHMLNNKADPNHAFQGACYAGDLNLVNQIMKHKVTEYDWGLIGVVEGYMFTPNPFDKYYKIVNILVNKGVDLNIGLDHIKILKARIKLETAHNARLKNEPDPDVKSNKFYKSINSIEKYLKIKIENNNEL